MGICEISPYPETMKKAYHYPVLYREVKDMLSLEDKKIIVDCTIGIASFWLKSHLVLRKDALLIGIDKDESSLKIAESNLSSYKGHYILIKGDFSHLRDLLKKINITGADAFFFDLGISTYQLTSAERGFSFLQCAPLDMRIDRDTFISASDLLNNLSEFELKNIFKKFGEENYSAKIAANIVEARKKEPINTTSQLVEIILKSIPPRMRYSRIHPATRVFQALRIVVNRELDALSCALPQAISLLNKGGRIGVISFHSLEDRIVKHTFRDYATRGVLKIINKKPIMASGDELKENISSRSAKLRIAERI